MSKQGVKGFSSLSCITQIMSIVTFDLLPSITCIKPLRVFVCATTSTVFPFLISFLMAYSHRGRAALMVYVQVSIGNKEKESKRVTQFDSKYSDHANR